MKPVISIGWASGALACAAVLAAPGVPAADDTSAFIAAICSAETRPAAKDGPRKLVLIADMGTGRFPITTKVPAAQTWFDYGVKLYHGYYHEDAKAAFKRAEELDPACAMCAWGEAWARGPTLNYDIKKDETAAALALAEKAHSLAIDATPKEQALIAAMITRYTNAGKTGSAEPVFAKAMDAIAADYPDDDQVADIAAHGWMIAANRENTKEMRHAVDELEAVLKRDPNDTAAIHYYIHATELVGKGAKAEPYANKLAGLAPQASHLVHMAAHTFFRVGRYYEAAGVNARALGVDGAHSTAVNASGDLGGMFYYGHNLGFGLAGAMTAGDRALSLKFADHVAVAYPKGKGDNNGNMINRAMIAYGRWTPDHALDLPDPGATAGKGSERTFWHYARGEAYAAKGDAAAVETEARAITGKAAMPTIGRAVLLGRVAMLQNRPAAAARAFETAARLQEKEFADAMDPPPWWYPVRRSVAAAQLKAGDFERAAKNARDSLAAWPHDPLALTVLARAEVGLGKATEAQAHMDEARRVWRGDLDKMSLDRI